MKITFLLVCSSLVYVQAYPGGQQHRASLSSSSTAVTTDSSSPSTIASPTSNNTLQAPRTSTVSAQSMIASGPTAAVAITSNLEAATNSSSSSSSSQPTNMLTHRRDSELDESSSSSLLGLIENELIEDDDYESDCDEDEDEDDDNDFDEEEKQQDNGGKGGRNGKRGGDSVTSRTAVEECSRIISSTIAQLKSLKAKLQTSRQHTLPQKRQLSDALDEEQAYGNRGKDLTQEQKASLEALVKGINGYQASLDGAGNTGQTEKEAWQQTTQTLDSIPFLANATPAQMRQLLDLIKIIQTQARLSSSSIPSSTSVGSEIGENASQASWMVPEESSLHEAGYTATSTGTTVKDTIATAPDSRTLILQARLQELKKQELELMALIHGQVPATPQRGGHPYNFQSGNQKSQTATGLKRLSAEQLEEVTAMVLEEEAKARASGAAVPTTNTPPLQSTTSSISAERRQETKQSTDEELDMVKQLLEMGGFDSSKLAAALATPPSMPSLQQNKGGLLSLLLNELPLSLQQKAIQRLQDSP